MPYSYSIIATKPEGTKFFKQVNPEMAKSEIEWVRTQPGFIDNSNVNLGPNTVVSTLVFEDKASFDAMYAGLLLREDYQTRIRHIEENGITRVIKESET